MFEKASPIESFFQLRSFLGIRCCPLKVEIALIFLAAGIAHGQTVSYKSPHKHIRAMIVPVGRCGLNSCESLVEIRGGSGKVLASRSFASPDHSRGAVVTHAAWTADGSFFVFSTTGLGGHQPWHLPTYFYSSKNNRFYSLDCLVGPITAEFTLQGNTLFAKRLSSDAQKRQSVSVRLDHWR